MLALVAELPEGLAETVTTLLCTRSLTLGSGASLNPHRVGCAVFSVIDDGRAGSALKRQVLRQRRNRLPQKYRRGECAKALE